MSEPDATPQPGVREAQLYGDDAYTQDVLETDVYAKRGKVSLTSQQTLGQRIFAAVVLLSVLMLASVIGWASLTYPSISDITALAPSDASGADRLQMWREAKAEWVQQLVTVSQMGLFGSLIPLLGTIAGYLLGEKASRETARPDEI